MILPKEFLAKIEFDLVGNCYIEGKHIPGLVYWYGDIRATDSFDLSKYYEGK